MSYSGGVKNEGNNPPPKLLKYIYHKTAEVVKQKFFYFGT